MHHEHPLRILRHSQKSVWLLIFPLLRGAYHIASAEDVLVWLHGAWFDLLILLAILGYGALDWYFRLFQIADDQIYVQEGVFYTRRSYLPLHCLSALTIEHPFLLRPIRACYVYADTAAGLLDATDIRLMIRHRDERLFLEALPNVHQGQRHHAEHKGGFWRILFFSVIFSSSFTGSLYLAAFWFQAGRIARDLITQYQLDDRFNEVSETVARRLNGIPPVAVSLAIIILSTWLLSFISNLLRYGNFDMHSDRRIVSVRSGLLTRRRFILRNKKINFVDIRQNLWTVFFRIYSIAVNCPGYGNKRGSIPICLPIQTRRELDNALPMLFPDLRLTRNTLRPPWHSWWGYVCWPVMAGAVVLGLDYLDAIFPAVELAQTYFPALEGAISFLRIMLLIPITWKLLVQITAIFTTGVSIADGRICVRYARFTTFHTIIADTDCVVKVRIYRHLWQRISGKCHVVLYFQSEVTRRCMLRSMNYAETLAQLGEVLANCTPLPEEPQTSLTE